MNWSDDDGAPVDAVDEGDAAGTELEEDCPGIAPPDEVPANALFPGDVGALELDTRRALVQLLSGPSLDGRRHSKLWSALMRNERILRSRLCELFLELVIDRDQQVAFTRQADTGGLEVPILLRRAQLTFIDSALVLFLRQRLAQADAHSERAVVARNEMVEHLSMYERNSNTDRAGFVKRVNASVEKFKKNNILQVIRNSDSRFEISPTLKLLFSAEEIQALAAAYRQISPEDAEGVAESGKPAFYAGTGLADKSDVVTDNEQSTDHEAESERWII